MKKLICASTIIACVAASSFADTVTFGGAEGWKTQGFNDNLSTVETATITTNDITFALTATGSANINTTAGVGPLFGITGGGQSYNIDNASGTASEWVELSLSVSGLNAGNITSLSLDNLQLFGFFGTEVADLFDGTTTQGIVAGTDGSSLDYNTLSTLNALSAVNIGGIGDDSWLLRITAPSGAAASAFQISDLTVSYAIPEPATLGLVASVGVGIFFIRRNFMI